MRTWHFSKKFNCRNQPQKAGPQKFRCCGFCGAQHLTSNTLSMFNCCNHFQRFALFIECVGCRLDWPHKARSRIALKLAGSISIPFREMIKPRKVVFSTLNSHFSGFPASFSLYSTLRTCSLYSFSYISEL